MPELFVGDISFLASWMDDFASRNSPKKVDIFVSLAFEKLAVTQEDLQISVRLKIARLVLKHLLPLQKHCYNGGQILVPFFRFSLHPMIYMRWRDVLPGDFRDLLCYQLGIVQLPDQNQFVAHCDEVSVRKVLEADRHYLHARHGVQMSATLEHTTREEQICYLTKMIEHQRSVDAQRSQQPGS
jgi:hypothetical protein